MTEARERSFGRNTETLRPVEMTLDFVRYPAGSVLVSMGHTRVLCNASVEEKVPRWMKGKGEGWVTAEYAMLPASTNTRGRRERNGVSGRSAEIQRLIGRSLRAAVDRTLLGERTITIDCDVVQADGGTRTASITGGFVALALACARLVERGELEKMPLIRGVSAVSCGVVGGIPMLDLDYEEDSGAGVDMNLVMTSGGDIVEIQGTGEGGVMSRADLDALVSLGEIGCAELTRLQAKALAGYPSLVPLWGQQ